MAQQRTLQYFAVAFFTAAMHPRRAQIRRIEPRESGSLDPVSPSTAAVYGCALAVCQRIQTTHARHTPWTARVTSLCTMWITPRVPTWTRECTLCTRLLQPPGT